MCVSYITLMQSANQELFQNYRNSINSFVIIDNELKRYLSQCFGIRLIINIAVYKKCMLFALICHLYLSYIKKTQNNTVSLAVPIANDQPHSTTAQLN